MYATSISVQVNQIDPGGQYVSNVEVKGNVYAGNPHFR